MSSVQTDATVRQRLLLPLVERIAQTDPDRVYSSIPKTDQFQDGYANMTFHQLKQAVNRAAGWLENTFGRNSTFETLGYIGLSDIRYVMLVLAGLYVGCKVIFQ